MISAWRARLRFDTISEKREKQHPPFPGDTAFYGLHTETLLEAINAAAAVNQLLLAGEEGMALRADFNPQFLLGGAGLKGFAAHTADDALFVLGMDLFLHSIFTSFARAIRIHGGQPMSRRRYYSMPFSGMQVFF